MDDHLPILEDNHDQLKKVAGAIGTDGEPAVGIFSCGLGGKGMFDGVGHVLVGDPVSPGGGVDLHPN